VASRRKILVFLSAVLMIVALVLGTLLYVVEGPAHGFKDIPTSVYWAITTITTVGFGDITPKTDAGALHRLGDDADRLGHAGGAHRHRHLGNDGPASAAPDHPRAPATSA
jgi:hypothetical protein